MIRRFVFVCCVAVAACGSPNVDPFLGSWSVSGNVSTTVGAQTQTNSGPLAASSYTLVFTKGIGADLQSLDNFGCKLLWSVSGNTATLNPMQTCTASMPGTGAIVFSTTAGSAIVSVVSATQLSGTGSLIGTCGVMGTMSSSCSSTLGGTLTKLP